jgi:two-component system sensor histidine kinase KdpD
MDEAILVCVYYGPNGERLIARGGKLASSLECPLFILTVDPQPEDEWDIEKIHYIEKWKQLAEQHDADEFIIRYNEKRQVAKVIGEVAKEKSVTQLIIGQTAQSRWEEITKRSFINVLLSEIPFVDLHIISVSRELKTEDGFYEKGIRAYMHKDDQGLKLCFNHTHEDLYEGIFYKEIGTDFNNGVFKLMKNGQMIEVNIVDDYATDPIESADS